MKFENKLSRVLLAVLYFICGSCQTQAQHDIILLRVKDNYYELTKAVRFLNSNNPKLICLNVDLFECEQTIHQPSMLLNDDVDHFDSLTAYSELRPSEAEKQLLSVLSESDMLLMPSVIQSLGTETADVIGCEFVYPDNASVGFINLIHNDRLNYVEKFQVSVTDGVTKNEAYHFAVNIAFVLDAERTQTFINVSREVVKLDFSKKRIFTTYDFNDIESAKWAAKDFIGKVVIVSARNVNDDLFVVESPKENQEAKRMTTSEIFANIACQIIEN